MISPDLSARVDDLVARARRTGRPLAAVLDDAKLLVTPLREEEIVEVYMRDLLARFERRDAALFMRSMWGRSHGSPQDMYDAIHGWLTAYVNQGRVSPSAPRS